MLRRTGRLERAVLLVAVFLATLSGCEQGSRSSTPPASSQATLTAASLKARGDELSQRGHHEDALTAYQEALRQDPNDVALRYAIAVTLAALDRRAEATEAFRWVAHNGLPGTELVDKAETWLRAAGALAATSDLAADKPADKPAPETRLRGHITWTKVDPNRPPPRVHLRLEGTDANTRGGVYNTTGTLNGDYEFVAVPPGSYRLTAQSPLIAVRLWDLEVTVQESTTVVDLSEASSIAPGTSFAAKPR